LRGARNAFSVHCTASGEGDKSVWDDFKSRCAAHQITEFYQLEALLRDGAVPQDIVDWIIAQRDSDNCEFRSYFVVYYILLHPELNPGLSSRDFPEYDPNRKPYTREMSF
jgi:hypothetical protein